MAIFEKKKDFSSLKAGDTIYQISSRIKVDEGLVVELKPLIVKMITISNEAVIIVTNNLKSPITVSCKDKYYYSDETKIYIAATYDIAVENACEYIDSIEDKDKYTISILNNEIKRYEDMKEHIRLSKFN